MPVAVGTRVMGAPKAQPMLASAVSMRHGGNAWFTWRRTSRNKVVLPSNEFRVIPGRL